MSAAFKLTAEEIARARDLIGEVPDDATTEALRVDFEAKSAAHVAAMHATLAAKIALETDQTPENFAALEAAYLAEEHAGAEMIIASRMNCDAWSRRASAVLLAHLEKLEREK